MPRLIIVGSGIAGLFTALCAYRHGVRDIVVSDLARVVGAAGLERGHDGCQLLVDAAVGVGRLTGDGKAHGAGVPHATLLRRRATS